MSNTITQTISVLDAGGPLTISQNRAGSINVANSVSATIASTSTERFVWGNTVTTTASGGSGGAGIALWTISDVVVAQNTVRCASLFRGRAVLLRGPVANVQVLDNQTTNCEAGVYTNPASGIAGAPANLLIKDNDFTGSDFESGIIYFYEGVQARVENNKLTCTPESWTDGRPYGYGLYFQNVRNTEILSNTIRDCGVAINLWGEQNTIRANTLANNRVGFEFYEAHDNRIYNNIIRRDPSMPFGAWVKLNSCTGAGGCTNTWRVSKQTGPNIVGGPFLGGNYYNLYTGPDDDGDWLGDTPMVLAAGNSDPFPLLDARLIVNSTANGSDRSPGDGRCDTGRTIASGASECTLQAAIEEANALAGKQTVGFDIPGSGMPVIRPARSLPPITEAIKIDGSSQPAGRVVIDGDVTAEPAYGLTIRAGDTGVRGLTVRRFRDEGILFDPNGILNETLEVVESEVSDNGGWGVRAIRGTAVTIKGPSTIARNGCWRGSGGVLVAEGALTVRDAQVTGNCQVGIRSADSGSPVELENVQADDNAESGVSVVSDLRVRGQRSTFLRNGADGISSARGDVWIDEGMIAGNRNNGILGTGALTITGKAYIAGNASGGTPESAGIRIGGDRPVVLRNVTLQDNAFAGMRVLGRQQVVLENVLIQRHQANGLEVHGELVFRGDRNVVRENQSGIFGVVDWLQQPWAIRVFGNLEVTDNREWGIITGGTIKVEGRLKVAGNNRNRSGRGGGIWILPQRQANGTAFLLNAEISDNGGSGISAPRGLLVRLIDATVAGNTGHGVDAEGEVEIWGNTVIRANGNDGIHGSSGTRVWIETAEVRDNCGWGIHTKSAVDVAGGPATITRNGRCASSLAGAGGIYAQGGMISLVSTSLVENGGPGAWSQDVYPVVGKVNGWNLTVTDNLGDGLGAFEVVVRGGVICRNGGSGIRATRERLQNVRLCDNTSHGTVIGESSGIRTLASLRVRAAAESSQIEGSEVSGNRGDGIVFQSGGGLMVAGTNIAGNTGVGLRNTSGVTVTATGDWWGGPAGSGGITPAVSGAVSVTDSLAEPVGLRIEPRHSDSGVLSVSPGLTATAAVRVSNWAVLSDTVSVTAIDSQGWLAGSGQVTLDLAQDSVARFDLRPPVGTALGTTSQLTVTARSLLSPTLRSEATYLARMESAADLSVSGTWLPGTVLAGTTVSGTWAVRNAGPDTATGVTLTLAFSPTVALERPVASQGSCTTAGAGLSCALGQLAPGSEAAITLEARPAAAGSAYGTARVGSALSDPNPDDNEAGWSLTGLVSLSVGPGQGGVLSATGPAGDRVTLTVPSRAVTATGSLLLSIGPVMYSATPRWNPSSFGLVIAEQRDGTLLPASTFAEPVELTVVYTDATIPGMDETRLQLGWWDAAVELWQRAETTCPTIAAPRRDTVNNRLTTAICQGGDLALFEVKSYPYAVFVPAVLP